MRTRATAFVLLAATALGACVPYPNAPVDDQVSSVPVGSGYPGLGQGSKEVDSQHFKLSAYGDDAQKLSDAAESEYDQLVQDAGIVTFTPIKPYPVFVYASQEEYRHKTGQPDWSIGTVVDGAIFTYSSDSTPGWLSHLMTQAVLTEFMNGRLTDQQRWVVEGLATYEEFKTEGRRPYDAFRALLSSQPIPLDQLENMAPPDERDYAASAWYGEANGLVRWLIERGGKINFGAFLTGLSQGQSFDQAVQSAYPGLWTSLPAVLSDWQGSLQ